MRPEGTVHMPIYYEIVLSFRWVTHAEVSGGHRNAGLGAPLSAPTMAFLACLRLVSAAPGRRGFRLAVPRWAHARPLAATLAANVAHGACSRAVIRSLGLPMICRCGRSLAARPRCRNQAVPGCHGS
jgi:hypothetical protein